jgi:hypothetical protein
MQEPDDLGSCWLLILGLLNTLYPFDIGFYD